MENKIKVIVAGGGTGGHLFPAIALAREIEKRFPGAEILFFGTKRGIEAKILPEMGYRVKLLWLRGFQRKIGVQLLIFPFRLLLSIMQCAAVILKFRPDIVIGTGGYVSGPALFLSAFLGFPTIIQEQNSYPGMTTRILSRFVKQVHLSFEESEKYFKAKEKLYFSGNPIRSALNQVDRTEAVSRLGISDSKKTLLIFGGSQGAHSVNQAILHIFDRLMEQSDWQVIWGSGEADYKHINEIVKKYATRVYLKPFINDMGSAYSAADLVIARAGATTLAEVQACGLPVLLIPYPYAAAGHQEANARALVNNNAAKMILDNELQSEKFSDMLFSLMADEQERKTLGANLKKLAKPRAAETIIDELVKLI